MVTHNQQEINADALFELLDSIKDFFEEEILMYALGGTALTILGIKPSTLDVDVNIETRKQYDYVCKIFNQIGFERSSPIRWKTQEGLAFDLFHSSNILGTDLLDDCLEKSQFIKEFGKIKLYILPLQDIIISKLARGDPRDFTDIKMIFEKEDINLEELAQRYYETMEDSVVNNSKQKFLDLIEIKFNEWGFDLNQELISRVKEWDIQ